MKKLNEHLEKLTEGRKVTQNALNAFFDERPFNSGNTSVEVLPKGATQPDMVFLKLHNNIIARKDVKKGTLEITNAGWETSTTKERLNGFPGVNIKQKAGVWYLNGEEWDGDWIEVS